ncbi:uncharacterized protein LOC123261130 isoform X1 [Cotesia glomerata]|uniref:uncharacterized protein LOC123261130 isoform X1 n=2 Tax=Cotesia glomerata TaxID=32391 RepID=UPI001D03308F|nr:uncharacterized protein LOC123261130 isoform X1 [Cotesia glomerata]
MFWRNKILLNNFEFCKSWRVIEKKFFHHERLVFGNEVNLAKKTNSPIVALESTIITHGMPYPDNFKTAMSIEEIIRKQNVTPATIGIIDGEIHVGMNEEQIHKLSKPDTKTFKCSAREICSIAAGGLNGGTTVGATVTIANLAGIAVMATGGIGGVHRNAENTFDISSDLIVMSHTPVSVVCAGPKAILDIPKTLEFLETHGVPVISIGTKMFPAFYSRTTVDKIPAPMTIPGAREAAKCINVQRMMKLSSGLIFAVPIPEAAALEPSEIEGLIETALREAESNKITGKEVTPYLLKRVKELTSGKSLSANKALIENNARVAAEIATELYNLSSQLNPAPGPKSALSTAINQKDQVVVIGGAVVDNILQVEEPIIKFDGRTNKGVSRKSFGGVARNIAASLLALGVGQTKFITVVGDDQSGLEIFRSFGKNGRIKILSGSNTARYTGIIDINGECHFGFGEMDLLNSIEPNLVRDNRSGFEKAKLIVLDGNPSLETINEVIDIAVNCSVPVWYEPTDVKKACKIFENDKWRSVLRFISPNVKELFTIAEYFSLIKSKIRNFNEDHVDVNEVKELTERLVEYIPAVITTVGYRGLLVARKFSDQDQLYNLLDLQKTHPSNQSKIQSKLYPPLVQITQEQLKQNKFSVSGCGDCLAGGIITGMLKQLNDESCIYLGLQAAATSLQSLETVPTAALNQLINPTI